MAVPQQNVDLPDCQENWEFASSRLFDTGDIKTSVRNADHSGWLLCNARAITGGPLKVLLQQLGSPFGVSGSDPLIPEGREKIFMGAGATHALGASFGSAASNMPSHTHVMNMYLFVDPYNSGNPTLPGTVPYVSASNGWAGSGASNPPFGCSNDNAGSGSATDGNYPPSVALNYFIHT